MKSTQNQQGTSSPQAGPNSISDSLLMELFEKELKSIYWAEKALTRALPGMAGNAFSPDLGEALKAHLRETLLQVQKVEKVFSLIGQAPAESKCEAMSALISAGEETMAETSAGAQRDTAIVASSQKVEHHEIACYGILQAYARRLGLSAAALILGGILQEEKNADASLGAIGEAICRGKGPGITAQKKLH